MVFVVSLLAAVLCVPFAKYQSGLLAVKVLRGGPTPQLPGTLADDPRQTKEYLTQSLEVAYGFPAAILTILAYEELFRWKPIVTVVLFVAVVGVSLFLAWAANPAPIRLFLRLRLGPLSFVTIGVLAANVAGFLLSAVGVN